MHLKPESLPNLGSSLTTASDDQFSYSPALSNDSQPAMIETHGTEVTLLGQDEEANTAMPTGASSPAWISKYLNSRYYRFPQAVTVRVDEASLADHSDPAGIRALTGQEAYLDDHAEPLLVAVDYVVDGPRTAAAVAAGRSRLTGMNYQTAEGGLQSVEANDIAGVLQALGSRPRLYNDALFGLAVEAQSDLRSPSDIDDIDDIRTMLCLHYGKEDQPFHRLGLQKAGRVIRVPRRGSPPT